ncbi:MAG: polyprenyl synthetase family protein [Bacteroidetes bacterium]|nr:polyprenyl synthetase family protein [Bacteroidota bacterium]
MHSISELQSILKNTFDSASFSQNPPELYDPITYTLNLGGKRIRPLLVLTGCDLFHGNLEKAKPAAIAIELFHNFTLLHDDIMDRAPLRRGKETVYKKWNTNVAILSGDTMFALACDYLSRVDPEVLPLALSEFTKTARLVCEGQQYDMNFEARKLVSISEYLEMIRLKTAVLIGCSLRLGAILAKAPATETEKIYSFGENIGMAFQLQDDLLDVFGDEQKFGKEIGGDILSAKKTFLLLKAYELAPESERSELDDCFSDPDLLPEAKIERVKNVYLSLNISQITKEEIGKHFTRALQICGNLNADPESRKVLEVFANDLLKRDF